MNDCRFCVSPVNYPDPDPDPDPEAAHNQGADQTAQMRRLICVFVVRI